jgi:hypothetical protein
MSGWYDQYAIWVSLPSVITNYEPVSRKWWNRPYLVSGRPPCRTGWPAAKSGRPPGRPVEKSGLATHTRPAEREDAEITSFHDGT